MHKLLAVACALVALALPAAGSAACGAPGGWERWKHIGERMISPEGRVIDHSDDRLITTSEGQSYALFFALVDNDRALFRRLARWTEKNLAGGDFTSNLPSWLWGRRPSGEWGVLDENSAADSDLWIAYSLLEAGRLWQERSYTVLGTLLLQRMALEEAADPPGLGPVLLPGAQGFVHEGRWKLNPSYLPPQLASRAAAVLPGSPWDALASGAYRFLTGSAPKGLAPDWISWTSKGFESLAEDENVGSYDAIRVYLWVGMLDDQAPRAAELKRHFKALRAHLSADGTPPEKIDVHRGVAQGEGPPGFSAALLPLFSGEPEAGALRARLEGAAGRDMGYYNQMLTLFGEGWDQGRYRFGADGRLIPRWETCQ
ncbi:cellulose synthase complex periplasmic endoglucanase BcsZ [Parapusillimonas granuli]|uniref:cellulase n=1 Tax=Parapusillimonas granuli TaxID=380911 RepID=A0A853FUX9_9BURK|nr:cellulose synthase complex periplasmic endoglucanase BcsZ [Parapusillimonas granuli]MBB5216300.1 endoglucanase [Parapusillimonas granuli]MEB2400574.1 cellulose synthase complex periplasmic endoglucanase BcsZ [Alcaligenaceae bacterium]NYT47977.1 cellulase [Parapusillimonas granuli]